MIKSFRHKGLQKLFEDGSSKGVPSEMISRIVKRLEFLDMAERPEEMNVHGYNFHGLQGVPKRYSIHVNGPWCITFGWGDTGAIDVDFENYH